jgi:putative addiction module component (TIGR02574 family)
MSRALEEVYERAMQLPAEEQLELAERLLPYEELGPEWDAEIERRVNATDAGEASPIPWSDVRAELWAPGGGRKARG